MSAKHFFEEPKKTGKIKKTICLTLLLVTVFSGSVLGFYALISNENLNLLGISRDNKGNVSEDEKDSQVDDEADNRTVFSNVDTSKDGEIVPTSGVDGLLNIKLSDLTEWNKTCDWQLIVVNRDNEIPKRYEQISKNSQNEVVENLEAMIKAAKKESISIWVSSRFRDIKLQQKLFNREVLKHNKKGYSLEDSEKIASFYVARPNTSEHNMGVSVDFNGVLNGFYKTKEYKWLMDHGAEYGFILRYPKSKESVTGVSFEPWHFRYIGKDNALKISKTGKCLEEYVNSIK